MLVAIVLLLLGVLSHGVVAPTVLLLDQREYNYTNGEGVSMPMSTVTDATPPTPPPSAVLAVNFGVPHDAQECNHLVVDMGLERRIGIKAQIPSFATFWVWVGQTILDSGPFRDTPGLTLVWKGNVSLPSSLTTPGGNNSKKLATHRFVFPAFSRLLLSTRTYWLGATIGVARAYYNGTGNEVRWLTASSAIPTARLAATTGYRIVDRFQNGMGLTHPTLKNWTNATIAENWVISPLHAQSMTNHLAVLLSATCIGPTNLSDPMVLNADPPLYDPTFTPTPALPSPTPSLVSSSPPPLYSPSPTPTPLTTPSKSVVSPTPTPLSSTWSPPTPSQWSPSSSPVVVVGSPQPSPSPVEAQVISPSPAPTPAFASPSPSSGVESEKVSNEVRISGNLALILGIVLGITVLSLLIIALGLLTKWWVNRRETYQRVERENQDKFNQVQDLNSYNSSIDGDDADDDEEAVSLEIINKEEKEDMIVEELDEDKT